MRKTHNKEFKFKVAIAAIRGDMTIAEIVSQYQVASSLVHKWKHQLLSGGAAVFSGEKDIKNSKLSEREVEQLHAKIGRLTLENDFLSGALNKVR